MPTISIAKACNFVKIMTKSDNDFVIGISGARGIGKSTAMVHFLKELNNGWYDFGETHVYSKAELEDRLKNSPPHSIIGGDEVIGALFKREWQDDKQIEIVKVLNMYRDKCHKIFLLIPHFWDLDSAVRNSLIIKWWVYCYRLGEAVVFTHDANPFSLDPWNVRYNLRLWRKGHIYKSPNYLFNIRWRELTPSKYLEYKRVKAEKRKFHHQKELNERTKEKEVTKRQLVLALKEQNPEFSSHKIAQLLPNVARRHVYTVLGGK